MRILPEFWCIFSQLHLDISSLYNYGAYSVDASFSSISIRQGAPLGFKRFYAILNRFFVVLTLSPLKAPTLSTLYSDPVGESIAVSDEQNGLKHT